MCVCVCRQVDRDCEFLEQERIMDYSLLVGLHFREATNGSEPPTSDCQTPTGKKAKAFLSGLLGHRKRIAKKGRVFFLFLFFSVENGGSDESVPRLSRADVDQLLLDPAG